MGKSKQIATLVFLLRRQMLLNGRQPLPGEQDVYYHDIVDAFDEEQKVLVFQKFTVDGWANEVEGWETINTEGVSVSVTAYAIQADGFDDPLKSKEENVADVWAALKGKTEEPIL